MTVLVPAAHAGAPLPTASRAPEPDALEPNALEPNALDPNLPDPCSPAPHSPATPAGPPRDFPDGVHVVGLGRTGLAVALLLAASGVPALALWDPATVRPDDLGTGYQPADLGRPRAAAAERRVRDLHPRVRVFPDHGREPALMGGATVALAPGGVDEALVVRALASGHPLLPVALGTRARIGPWTLPEEPGCTLCAGGGDGPAGASAAPDGFSRPGGGEAEAVVDALRTAVAVHDALSGGRDSPAWRAVWEVAGPGGGDVRRPVSPVPGCPCDPDALAARLPALPEGWPP